MLPSTPYLLLRPTSAVAASTPFGLTFIGNTDQGTPSGGTSDFGTVSIGAADATRQIIIAVGARFTTAATLTGITVGVASASLIPNADATLANNADASLWIISVPSGTTADITANYSATILRASISVYRMVGTGASASAGNASSNTSGAASISSSGLSIPAGGGAVGVAVNFPSATSSTTTNMTQDNGHLIAASTTWFASGSNTSGSGATTFSFNLSPATTDNLGAWATFNP